MPAAWISRIRASSRRLNIAFYRDVCDLKRGDLLIGRIGTLGRAVLIDTDDEFSLFVSVGLIRFSQQHIAPEFLRTLLNSPLAEANSIASRPAVGRIRTN